MIIFFIFFLISITSLSLQAEDNLFPSFRSSVITDGKPILRGGGPEPEEEDENPVSSVIEDGKLANGGETEHEKDEENPEIGVIEDGELVLSGVTHEPDEDESSDIDKTELKQVDLNPSNFHNELTDDLTVMVEWLIKNYGYKIDLHTRRQGDSSSAPQDKALRSHSKKRKNKKNQSRYQQIFLKKHKHKPNKKKVKSIETYSGERSETLKSHTGDSNTEYMINMDISKEDLRNEKLNNANWGISTKTVKFDNFGSIEENDNANDEDVNRNEEHVNANDEPVNENNNDNDHSAASINLLDIVNAIRDGIPKIAKYVKRPLEVLRTSTNNDIGTSHSNKKHKSRKKLQKHTDQYKSTREMIPQRRFMAPEEMHAEAFRVREGLRKARRRERKVQKKFLQGQQQRWAMYGEKRRSNNPTEIPTKVKLRAENGKGKEHSWVADLKAYMEELISRVSRTSVDQYARPIIKAIEEKNNVKIADIDVDRLGNVMVDYVDLSRNNGTYIDKRKISYTANERKNTKNI